MSWDWPEYIACAVVSLIAAGLLWLIAAAIWEDHHAATRPDREDHKIVTLGQCATYGSGAMVNGAGGASTSTECAALDDHGGVHRRSSPFVVGEVVICRKNCAVPE